MNYVHAVLLLHSAQKELNEANVSKVVEATGEKADTAQIKALVASLNGVDIEQAVKQAVVAAPAQAHAAPAKAEEKKEEKPKEESVEGLASLFG